MSTLAEQFRQDGFLLIRNFLDKSVVENIYREAREIFAVQIKHVTGRTVDIDDRDAFGAPERDKGGFPFLRLTGRRT